MSQQFCLKWNNHMNNMMEVFKNLLSTEAMVDVTLACDGLSLKAHKIVLSACSPFFQALFLENPCKHPIVILKDMKYSELKAIIEFMYHGEVNVAQDQLSALMKTAETLRVKGLAETTNEKSSSVPQDDTGHRSSVPRTDTPPPKRRRGRTRKRSLSDSNRSDDESEPKIKQPDSPEIEELSDVTIDTSAQYSNMQSQVPLSSHSTNTFHKSSISHEPQIEEPVSADESFTTEEKFGVEPSKLLEQTLTTDDLPNRRSGRSSVSSNMEMQRRPRSTDHSMSVPTPAQSEISNQQPESPPDIKPELLELEPAMSPVAGPSHSTDNSMMMFMDQSNLSVPGPSGYQDNSQALVPQDSSTPQDSRRPTAIETLNQDYKPLVLDKRLKYLTKAVKSLNTSTPLPGVLGVLNVVLATAEKDYAMKYMKPFCSDLNKIYIQYLTHLIKEKKAEEAQNLYERSLGSCKKILNVPSDVLKDLMVICNKNEVTSGLNESLNRSIINKENSPNIPTKISSFRGVKSKLSFGKDPVIERELSNISDGQNCNAKTSTGNTGLDTKGNDLNQLHQGKQDSSAEGTKQENLNTYQLQQNKKTGIEFPNITVSLDGSTSQRKIISSVKLLHQEPHVNISSEICASANESFCKTGTIAPTNRLSTTVAFIPQTSNLLMDKQTSTDTVLKRAVVKQSFCGQRLMTKAKSPFADKRKVQSKVTQNKPGIHYFRNKVQIKFGSQNRPSGTQNSSNKMQKLSLTCSRPFSGRNHFDVKELEKIVSFLQTKISLKYKNLETREKEQIANNLARQFFFETGITVLDKAALKILISFSNQNI